MLKVPASRGAKSLNQSMVEHPDASVPHSQGLLCCLHCLLHLKGREHPPFGLRHRIGVAAEPRGNSGAAEMIMMFMKTKSKHIRFPPNGSEGPGSHHCAAERKVWFAISVKDVVLGGWVEEEAEESDSFELKDHGLQQGLQGRSVNVSF